MLSDRIVADLILESRTLMSPRKPLAAVISECGECGKVMHVFASRKIRGRGKFCSRPCASRHAVRACNGIPDRITGAPIGRHKSNPPVAGVAWKHHGALAEIMACEWMIRQGYEVFRNISSHGLADYVAWRPGQSPILIDVKTAGMTEGGTRRTFPSASQAQIAAGVKILFVDRVSRTISFAKEDFNPPRLAVGNGAANLPPEMPQTSAEAPPHVPGPL